MLSSSFPAGRERTMTDQQMAQINQQFEHVSQEFKQINRRFEHVGQEFTQINQRLEQVNEGFKNVNQRFDQMDQRFDQVDKRFGEVDERFELVGGELQRLGVQFEDQRQKLELIAETIQIGQDVTAAKLDELTESIAEQIDPLKALGENHEKRLNKLETRPSWPAPRSKR